MIHSSAILMYSLLICSRREYSWNFAHFQQQSIDQSNDNQSTYGVNYILINRVIIK